MTNLFSLAAQMAELPPGSLPPIHNWSPRYCGEIDMEIRRDGVWFHEGTPIGRAHLVRLFSTILCREGDDYFLVTPVEKVKIRVEDVPFIAIHMDAAGDREAQKIMFRTNVGDGVTAGKTDPISFRPDPAAAPAGDRGPVPYVHVRGGLEARLSRSVYYELANYVTSHNGIDGVWAGGTFFPFGIEGGR